jgi:hypothetical protein
MVVDLSSVPKECVYIVYDEVARSFYVGYTLSMGNTVGKLWEMTAGRPTLEFRVLTVSDDLTTLKLHTEYYRNMYLDAGFSEMGSRGRKTLQYKVRIVVAPDFKNVDVQLVSARGDGVVVGRFKTKQEARDFTLVYYGDDNLFRLPVYATNSLTKELLLDIGKPRGRGI